MFAVPEFTVPAASPAAVRQPLSLAALLRSAVTESALWCRQARFQPGRPASVGLPGAGLAVVGWLPGQRDDLVSHAQSGAFAVVAGEVVEYAGGTTRTLRAGQIRVFGPGYRHQLANLGDSAAVTVHTPAEP